MICKSSWEGGSLTTLLVRGHFKQWIYTSYPEHYLMHIQLQKLIHYHSSLVPSKIMWLEWTVSGNKLKTHWTYYIMTTSISHHGVPDIYSMWEETCIVNDFQRNHVKCTIVSLLLWECYTWSKNRLLFACSISTSN